MKLLRVSLTTVAVVAAATLIGPPGAVAAPQHAAATLPTRAELRSARLTLADLPADYRLDTSRDSGTSSTSSSTDPACTKQLERLDAGGRNSTAPRKAKKAFLLDSTTGPFVESSVGAWRTKAAAVGGIASIRSLLRGCDRWTETDADGSTATVRLTRLPMPALGNERIAFRATLTVGEGAFMITARADFAVVRVRTAVTTVSVVSFGAADGVDLVDLTRISAARLRAVVGQ